MRYALVNPRWDFSGSIYFGCREPHLPLEYGYAKALLEAAGHDVVIIDCHARGLTENEMLEAVDDFRPGMTVVPTAPTYLFWRCPPPELKQALRTVEALKGPGGIITVVGPHGSTTPVTVLKKLGADIVVMGECEEALLKLAGRKMADLKGVPSICYREDGSIHIQGSPHESNMALLPPLSWATDSIRMHPHHHHRFDGKGSGFGAEIEASRGCPYSCSFCSKNDFRNTYRKRPAAPVLKELDNLMESGAGYVYFVDEIFLPDKKFLEALSTREIRFGVQTRIDLWDEERLRLLGKAGCVSIEAGVESITVEGRAHLNKKCRASTEEIERLLVFARERVPFVQATLLDSGIDNRDEVERWRERLLRRGVWSNEPVPMFPYPGTGEYRRRWGLPDGSAWERAHDFYLNAYSAFSDIQEQRPLKINELERLNEER